MFAEIDRRLIWKDGHLCNRGQTTISRLHLPCLGFKKLLKKCSEEGQMQGARSAETGMYMEVHEDFEHCATPQVASTVIF